MNIQHILIDDNSPIHRELSIYRTGTINRVRLQDAAYATYGSLAIDAHNYAALFHYGLPEALNHLPFISESNNGLDSWDEAFLHHSSLNGMRLIVEELISMIDTNKHETILLGWQDKPIGIAYYRDVDPARFVAFLEDVICFVVGAAEAGYDLEFIL